MVLPDHLSHYAGHGHVAPIKAWLNEGGDVNEREGRAREGLAAPPAIKFILRRADNGVLWNILSFWQATN